MRRFLLLILSLLSLNQYSPAQDTIRHGKPVRYSPKRYPVQDKMFVSKLGYAREDIVFSAGKKRVEYCYYYGQERNCYGKTHEILNDSVLLIKENESDTITELWRYRKISQDLFEVRREYDKLQETGLAMSLIPFQVQGKMAVRRADNEDTLWLEDHSRFDPHRNNKLRYEFHKSRVKGFIYPVHLLTSFPFCRMGIRSPCLA